MSNEKIYEQLGELKFNKKLKPAFVKELKSFLSKSHTRDSGEYPDDFCYFYINKNGNLGIKREYWYIEGVVNWLKYLIKNYFEPNGYKISGTIKNSLIDKIYEITVNNNKISRKQYYNQYNFEILKYIKSNAIRSYLRKEKYNFDANTAARLMFSVDASSGFNVNTIPINEKIRILNDIIKKFPNCTIYDDDHKKPWLSSHDIIKKYISETKKIIKKFTKKEKGYTYYWHIHFFNKEKDYICSDPFNDFDSCYKNIKKYVKTSKDSEIRKMKFYVSIDKCKEINVSQLLATLNNKFEFVNLIYTNNINDYELNHITYFLYTSPHLVHPFKQGDLLSYHDDPNMILIYGEEPNFNSFIYDGKEKMYFSATDHDDDTPKWFQLEYYKGDKKKNSKKISELKKFLDENEKCWIEETDELF